MNRLIYLVVAVGAMLLGGLGQANASTYQVNFVSSLSPNFDVSALIGVDGSNNVTSINGTVAGDGAITGLNTDPVTLWTYDNTFDASANPAVLGNGWLFNTAGWIYNLYSNGTTYFLSTLNPDGTNYNPGIAGEFSFSVVPVPPAILLFASALVGLVLLRRKSRKVAAPGGAFA